MHNLLCVKLEEAAASLDFVEESIRVAQEPTAPLWRTVATQARKELGVLMAVSGFQQAQLEAAEAPGTTAADAAAAAAAAADVATATTSAALTGAAGYLPAAVDAAAVAHANVEALAAATAAATGAAPSGGTAAAAAAATAGSAGAAGLSAAAPAAEAAGAAGKRQPASAPARARAVSEGADPAPTLPSPAPPGLVQPQKQQQSPQPQQRTGPATRTPGGEGPTLRAEHVAETKVVLCVRVRENETKEKLLSPYKRTHRVQADRGCPSSAHRHTRTRSVCQAPEAWWSCPTCTLRNAPQAIACAL